MSELSYQTIRSANQAREADELRSENRKKNLLILVMHYLSEQGYVESAAALSRETSMDMSKYEVCDNVDLETVLMDYESYYFVRFQRYPKVTKRQKESGDMKGAAGKSMLKGQLNGQTSLPKIPQRASSPVSNGSSGRPKSSHKAPTQRAAGAGKRDAGKQSADNYSNASGASLDESLQGLLVQGTNQPQADGDKALLNSAKQKPKAGVIIDYRSMINDATRLNAEEGAEDRLLKPLGSYLGYTSEWRELAQVISRDIFLSNPNVKWTDIIGLDDAKRLLKEAVVYPIKYPQLFTGILSPWKGLLLYGPPGTGKTLLAKAVATECKTTFFNISASSIVSKWRGDSEKLVRVLFEMARFHAPSTIFLDELESLISHRGSGGAVGEHEGSKRMKTELLIQMDGLSKTDDLVFLLAASNLPWELDHAMLRRLEKRILVDLPSPEAREAMYRHHLPPVVTAKETGGLELRADLDYHKLALETEGYSGSDIRLVCKEAAMRPVRKVFDALENHTNDEELNITLDPIATKDVMAALAHTKPSAKHLTAKYKAWQKEYESV